VCRLDQLFKIEGYVNPLPHIYAKQRTFDPPFFFRPEIVKKCPFWTLNTCFCLRNVAKISEHFSAPLPIQKIHQGLPEENMCPLLFGGLKISISSRFPLCYVVLCVYVFIYVTSLLMFPAFLRLLQVYDFKWKISEQCDIHMHVGP
jgi:hypothetical protein